MGMNIKLIKEDNYVQQMENVVLPYLKERCTDGFFERVKGENIYYRIFRSDISSADLVLVHGFTEGADKFNEVIYYFLQAGFNVWQIQQRGHGKSFREVKDTSLVHISDYRALVEDLHYFVEDIVKKNRTDAKRPLYLYGHSMGGGVSALYLETYPDDFQKAILTSPMLELDSGSIPVWVANIYAGIMTALGKGTNYMPGNKPFSPEPDFENSCSNCRTRFDYWFAQTVKRPEYQTCASSIVTAKQFLILTQKATDQKNCARVRTPFLLFQAGNDNMVKPGGQETFVSQTGKNGRLVRMESAKHEIYLCSDEDLEKYWKEILDFLE